MISRARPNDQHGEECQGGMNGVGDIKGQLHQFIVTRSLIGFNPPIWGDSGGLAQRRMSGAGASKTQLTPLNRLVTEPSLNTS